MLAKQRLLIIAIQVVISTSVLSQTLNGIYIQRNSYGNLDPEQYFHFEGNKVQFKLNSGGCIVTTYQGNGNYEIKDDKLLIIPVVTDLPMIAFPLAPTNLDTMKIHVNSRDSMGVSIGIYRCGNIVASSSTNNYGDAKIPRRLINNDDLIIVTQIGYIITRIPAEEKRDYIIRLWPGPSPKELYAFATNEGKGFKLKALSNSIQVKRAVYCCGQIENLWFTYVKFNR